VAAEMERVKEYLAIYAFKNEADAQLELAVNDVVEVPAHNSGAEAHGWIRGKNRRTGAEGYFPGTTSSKIGKEVSLTFISIISSGSCLTLYDRKVDIQSSAVPRRLLGSPSKSGSKFEDYNDSGYDGSPLSPGNYL